MKEQRLTDFVEQVTGESHLRVEDDLGDGFVRLRLDEAERRQAKHDIRSSEDIIIEMLRNARDAHAHTIFVALQKEGPLRHITMIDDGDGIPEHMQEKIFDARVTTKLDTMHIDTWGVHGRGMALYSIRVNTQSAYVADSMPGAGSAFGIVSDTQSLAEKTDQSTRPVFSKNDQGTVVVRGPKNIIRTVMEFAYVDREVCDVYCGSPAEIAATLYSFGMEQTSARQRAFEDTSVIPLCYRLSTAADPASFVELAAQLDLEISERTARRILDAAIKPLSPVAQSVALLGDGADATKNPTKHKAGKKPHKTAEGAAPRISKQDLEGFSQAVKDAYAELADAYYLDDDVVPEVALRKGKLSISIQVNKKDGEYL